MPAVISLDKITTVLRPKPTLYSFMPSNAAVGISAAQRPLLTPIQLDTVEYCLGLPRGGIATYKDSKLLVTTLQEDMVSLLRDARWALLPPREILEKIKKLYSDNHNKGTYNLTAFTEVIPEDDYEYEFLCLSPPDGCQWRVDGVAYSFPLQDFPRIRTTIHPCFLFTTLMKYMARGPQDQSHLRCMEDVVSLCDHINLLRIRPVYVSWLGATVTGRDFPNRMTPVARRDPPHFLPPPPSFPTRNRKGSGDKHVTIKSPPRSADKRNGASEKKAMSKVPPSSKAAVSRKTTVKKRKVAQSSLSSAVQKASARRRSPRLNKE
ncbi:hypothetical protein CPB85DRAFT_1307584 [Mucidula mucida]|nr:hypothetical protein CPB85DRAFT_1307584 [Mucidula mucida]